MRHSNRFGSTRQSVHRTATEETSIVMKPGFGPQGQERRLTYVRGFCSVCSLAVLPSRQDFVHVIQSYSQRFTIGKVTSTRNPFHIERNFKTRVTFLPFILFYLFPRFSHCLSPSLLLSHFFPSCSFFVSFFFVFILSECA
jgi:hypothetical protein